MDRTPMNNRKLSEEELARRRAARARQRRREQVRRRREKRRRSVLAVLALLFLAAAVVLVTIVIQMYREEQREIAVHRGLQQIYAAAVTEPQPTETAAPPVDAPADVPTQQPTLPPEYDSLPSVNDELQSIVDFENRISSRFTELYAINPELIGWIELGDTVSAPVVLRDNEFYLNHDFYGNDSNSGTVFADEKNADWLYSPFTLLYGHNMREGIMFGQLDDLKELDGLQRNTLLEFQLLYNEEARYYLPFAVVDASVVEGHSNYFHLRRFSIFRDETYDEQKIADFIAEIRNRSIVDIPGLDVAPSDRILGLVTCSYSSDNARLIVFFREIRRDESAADMCGLISANAYFRD